MSKIQNRKIKLFVILLLSISSCAGQNNEEQIKQINEIADSMPQVVGEKSYKRDKSFVEYTVREWMNRDYRDYHYLFQDYTNKNRSKIEIDVSSIYYSPDSLKLLSFVIIKQPINLSHDEHIRKNKRFNPSFSGHVVVGVRDSSVMPWSLYNFTQFRVFDYSTSDTIRLFLRIHFFEKFKENQFYCFNEKGEWGLYSFKYNLNEPEFWTGPVFDKERYKGLGYYFQIDDFSSPKYIHPNYGDKDGIRDTVPILKIDYPNELIKQFDRD
jgi:hypothetical protein